MFQMKSIVILSYPGLSLWNCDLYGHAAQTAPFWSTEYCRVTLQALYNMTITEYVLRECSLPQYTVVSARPEFTVRPEETGQAEYTDRIVFPPSLLQPGYFLQTTFLLLRQFEVYLNEN